MNKIQKVIKTLAICLAILIIGNIISLIIYGLSWIPGLNQNTKNDDSITFEESYHDIEEIELDIIASSITIKPGTEFKITATNMKNNFTSKRKKNTLKIEEKVTWFQKSNKEGKITITIPEDKVLDKLSVDTGAGKFTMTDIEINEFELDQGAGIIEISNSKLNTSDIDGGAGEIEIKNSTLNNLELDAGIGKIKLEAIIIGNSKINCGIGQIDLTLLETENDYQIKVEKGIGNIKINGENQSNSTTYGTGTNKLELEGGIGNINVNFK